MTPAVRPFTWAAAGLAAAALLVLAVRAALSGVSTPEDAGLRIPLVEAIAKEAARPVAGRLVGGFAYGPSPTTFRGGPSGRPSPDVRIAAAQIEKRAQDHPSVEADAALAVASLTMGDLDRAVELLEDAVRRDPTTPTYQSDLSAAYQARATWSDRADDWPRALAAADRALRGNPALTEAYFNRALALEGLHLDEQAEQAWLDYQPRDPSSPWSAEAAQRVERLRRREPSAGSAGERDLQVEREAIEDDLLTKWADATLNARTADAMAALRRARQASGSLAAAGGDTMPRDAVEMIAAAGARGDAHMLRALARGHQAFGRARVLFLGERVTDAARAMEEAASHFRQGGSPYHWWAPVFRAIALRTAGTAAEAMAALRAIPVTSLPDGYVHLRGRYHWTRAIALETLGRLDRARVEFAAAAGAFRRGHEREHMAACAILGAETDWLLGDAGAAWARALAALQAIDGLKVSTRRNLVLLMSAYFAMHEDLPETALRFQNALIASLERSGADIGRFDAFMQRARILTKLERQAEAAEDLERASRAAAAPGDPGLRARADAKVRAVRAELFQSSNPSRAAADIDEAVAYLRKTNQDGVPQLLRLRARIQQRLGDRELAHRALHDAVETVERDRARLSTPHDRMQSFQDERDAVSDLIAFELLARRDESEALRVAEQGRASMTNGAAPPAFVNLRGALRDGSGIPHDASIIYYVTTDERLFTWVIRPGAGATLAGDQPADRITALLTAFHRVVQRGGGLAASAATGADLYQALLAPALRHVPPGTRLVVVPDATLIGVPFAALPGPDGHPLLEERAVTVAPSLSAFLLATHRLAQLPVDDVRTFGDGHDPEASGLPRLPLADAEAAAVGGLYERRTVLKGPAATREAFLGARERVIHFAGHSIVNRRFPLFSRLLLAPGRDERADGALLGADLLDRRFTNTAVLVLASCESAAGPFVQGDGVLSLARLFVDAGIPSVVASLWPLDDRSHQLLLDFHRELRLRGDAASALQAAQRAALRRGGRDQPMQVWAGLVSIGGLLPNVTTPH